MLSTHDQLLGGPSGQSFLGSRFPADQQYGPLIGSEARKIGAQLAKKGVLGRFAVDFVVARNNAGKWDSYAIEINLRKGGTTHPFLIMQFLIDGSYDETSGVFRAPSGLDLPSGDPLRLHGFKTEGTEIQSCTALGHALDTAFVRLTELCAFWL